MNTFLTVLRKELMDGLRDRRTIAMIFIASVATGPIMLIMLSNFISSIAEKAEAKRIWVAGQQYAPTAINFFQRQGAEILVARDDYEKQVKESKIDAVIVFEDGFEDDLLAGRTASVELVYDDSQNKTTASINFARALIQGFGREQAVLRLLSRGVSPEVISAVKIDNTNLATPKQRGAQVLFLIPMTTLILCLTGGLAVAIDSTAGERERGSLEPLLLHPVRLLDLVLGKWTAVSLYATVVVLFATLGYVITLLYLPFRIELPLNFGWREFGLFALISIPLAAMMASALMLVATFGRTYKEAQTYASYLMTIVPFVPVLEIFGVVKEATWQLTVPVLGANMVFMRVLRGEPVGVEHFAVPALIALIFTSCAIYIITRLLRREEIVFGRA